MTAGFAVGFGAMGAAMPRLPTASVLSATPPPGREGVSVMPPVIVAVVVSHVLVSRSERPSAPARRAGADVKGSGA
ncbi:MAG TPA: hypothetical protein DD420_26470 [Streptomyces sp.]|nr:hypothetical protein [Streptomyces sp.]